MGASLFHDFFAQHRRYLIQEFLGDDPFEFPLWMISLAASLTLAAVIASIADLKHRHNLLSFTYKYVPCLPANNACRGTLNVLFVLHAWDRNALLCLVVLISWAALTLRVGFNDVLYGADASLAAAG